jgi:tRNA pseudouridine65 synthase
MFQGREVTKRYLAVVRGWPSAAGEIDYPLGAVRDDYDRADDQCASRQPAVTRFRTLATVELPIRVDRYPSSRYALLELEPLTGRRHQLRRHLHHVSHPVIGDTSYGKGRHNRLFEETFGCRRMLLACVNVAFAHPETEQVLQLHAPVDGSFARVLDELGWSEAIPP